jgi:cytochrome c556
MKKSSLSVVLGLMLGALVVFGFAMDEAELAKHMKGVGKGMGAVKKGMQGGDMAAVAEGAEAVAKNLTGTDQFWAGHKVDDAVTMTKNSIAAATALSAAAKGGDAAAAKEAFGKMGGTCKGCHDKYREKTGETYKVKLPEHH